MIKVAITGNIASGKSCVEEYIINAGFKVIDADKINHAILENDSECIKEIEHLFSGCDIHKENSTLSREKIGKIVFADTEKKQALEEILYKRISKKIDLYFEENKDEKIIFVSAAMLFESGFYKDYDKIIFVSAPEKIRLKRLIERNGYNSEYAIKRLKAQEAEAEKIKKSDYIIINDSDKESLKVKTNQVLKEISSL